jgi:predicted site-specific integrase-resolvase
LDKQIEDIKSGMSSDRPGLMELLTLVSKGQVELVIIENKDRLVRFGYEILENMFKLFGTKIVVLNELIEDKTYEQELTEDLISTIHYFTTKSYSHRRKLNKLRKEIEEQ